MKTVIIIFFQFLGCEGVQSLCLLSSGSSYFIVINISDSAIRIRACCDYYLIFAQIFMIGDIKKMSLSYAKCPNGDLHTGEILSLVCVDAKCSKRGLICPICRMMNHETHEVMPLKIFIDEVRKSFLQSQDAESLNNLSDYLRSIDESKKQLLSILRETAENIAKELKKVQQKIQENYLAIRKNILAQSTMSTKLPMFIENLIKKQENDPYKLQQQFQKYSELIKFDKSAIQISDKAKKIVQDYSAVPDQVSTVLKDQIQKIRTGFKDIFAEKSVKVSKPSSSMTFSTENKHKQLLVSDDKKQLYAPGVLQEFGVGYVNSDTNNQNRKITFRIESAMSGNIVIGMGVLKKDKQLAFLYNIAIQNQHFCINSDGYCENYDDQLKQDEDSLAGNSFNFYQNGTEVSVHYEGQKNTITFTKVGTQETKVLSTSKLSEEDKKDLQFYLSIGENDRVKIVEG